MNERQHIMILCLAAVLLVVVIATAAKTQHARMGESHVEVSIGTRASDFPTDAAVTIKAKSPLQPFSPTALSEEKQGNIWNRGLVYDVTLTSQASIYVLYTPR